LGKGLQKKWANEKQKDQTKEATIVAKQVFFATMNGLKNKT
jgi:hypothetical protein